MKFASFLKWWLIFVTVCVAMVFVYHTGFFKEIWIKDSSYLSYTTIVLFFVTSIFCGINTLNLCLESKNSRLTSARLQSYERLEEIGWFVSELCLTLGMIGTIVGFIMMLGGFESVDMANQITIQNLLTELGKSMATALYTTIVGLVCGSVLKLQYFNLSLELQKLEMENNEA